MNNEEIITSNWDDESSSEELKELKFRCIKCKKLKTQSDFSFKQLRFDKPKCRVCVTATQQVFQKKNPPQKAKKKRSKCQRHGKFGCAYCNPKSVGKTKNKKKCKHGKSRKPGRCTQCTEEATANQKLPDRILKRQAAMKAEEEACANDQSE